MGAPQRRHRCHDRGSVECPTLDANAEEAGGDGAERRRLQLGGSGGEGGWLPAADESRDLSLGAAMLPGPSGSTAGSRRLVVVVLEDEGGLEASGVGREVAGELEALLHESALVRGQHPDGFVGEGPHESAHGFPVPLLVQSQGPRLVQLFRRQVLKVLLTNSRKPKPAAPKVVKTLSRSFEES